MSDEQSALINPNTHAQFLSNLNGVEEVPYDGFGDWLKGATSTIGGALGIRPKLQQGDGVKNGKHEKEVREVQQHLGIYVDGDFGSGTAAAVARAQKNACLPTTGIVDSKTWKVVLGKKTYCDAPPSGGGGSKPSGGGGGQPASGGVGVGIASLMTALGPTAQAGGLTSGGAPAQSTQSEGSWMPLIIGGVVLLGIVGVGAYIVMSDDEE